RPRWPHHRRAVGVACPPRSGPTDAAPHRRSQTLGADAQTLRESGRSPRGTLGVCFVRRYRLACRKYTLFPIMSNLASFEPVKVPIERYAASPFPTTRRIPAPPQLRPGGRVTTGLTRGEASRVSGAVST